MTFDLNTKRSSLDKAKEFLISSAEYLALVPRLVFNFRVEIATIRGKIRGSGEYAVMLYVGRGINRAYLTAKLLIDAETISSEKTTLFSYRSRMRRFEKEADFIFVDIGIPYQWRHNRGQDHLVLPDWISMVIPITGDWEDVESGFNNTTRRQIRRNTYSYEISRDPEVIREFYDEYYLPYVTHRHQDASIDSRRSVERRARQGGILRVIGDDGPVVAGVVYPENGVLYYLWLGMPKRYLENQPPGALFASYYFCLRLAFENSCRAANWMGTRAFPTDGVFQFKRKWGPLVEDSFSPDSILFKPMPNNRNAIAFAETFPVIARRHGTLEQIFCTTAENVTDAEIKRMMSGYVCDGIGQITIAHVTEESEEPEVWYADAYPNVRVISVNAAQFSDLYSPVFSPKGP